MWCGHKSGKRAVLLAVILSLGLTACGSREKEKSASLLREESVRFPE